MVEDFYTHIQEGRMGRLIDAAKNKEVRKQDNVNNLDIESFVDHLNNAYTIEKKYGFTHKSKIAQAKSGGYIVCPIEYSNDGYYSIYYKFNGYIYIDGVFRRYYYELVNNLKQMFTINYIDGDVYISPLDKNKPITNSFFIEVFNAIQKELPKEARTVIVEEGRMGRLIDAAKNTEVRKQDDVNLDRLCVDELADYMKEKYETNSIAVLDYTKPENFNILFTTDNDNNVLHVCCEYSNGGHCEYSNGGHCAIHYFLNDDIYIHKTFYNQYNGKFKDLGNKFKFKMDHISNYWSISPLNGGDVTNSFFIEVFESIEKMLPEENRVFSLNEGRMGRLIDAAKNTEVRKQDDINHMNPESFKSYLNDKYQINREHIFKHLNSIASLNSMEYDSRNINYITCLISGVIGAGHFCIYYRFNESLHIGLTFTTKYPKLFTELQRKFNCEESLGNIYIRPKNVDWEITNEFFIEVFETIERLLPENHRSIVLDEINEGRMGKLIDAAKNSEVRKEDDIDLYDIEGMIDYFNTKYTVNSCVKDDPEYDGFVYRRTGVPYMGVYCEYYHNLHFRLRYMQNEYVYANPIMYKTYKKDFNQLEKKFKIVVTNTAIKFYPLDSDKITNSFFIEVFEAVERMIPKENRIVVLDEINEGRMGKLIDAAKNAEVRKEDSIDMLSVSAFSEYINSIYSTTGYDSASLYTDSYISCAVEESNGGVWCVYYGMKKHVIYIYNYVFDSYSSEFETLKNKFRIEKSATVHYFKPLNNDNITNTFFIQVVDAVLEALPKRVRYIKKTLNEGRMGRLIDASRSSEVRKQDSLDNLSTELLLDYIDDRYEITHGIHYLKTTREKTCKNDVIACAVEYSAGGIWNVFYDKETKRVFIHEVFFNSYSKCFEDLKTSFDTTECGIETHQRIALKVRYFKPLNSNKITNSFFIEVIDAILEALPESATHLKLKELNEGRMGRLIDAARSAEVRKQDMPMPKNDEVVDLGLPSGNLWCRCNLGAKYEYNPGYYFQYGALEGDNDGSHSTWETCPFNGGKNEYNEQSLTKANDEILSYNMLKPEYDVAHQELGDKFSIPSKDDFKELRDNTIMRNDTVNGIKGYRLTSKTNGNSIFIPLTGFFEEGDLHSDDTTAILLISNCYYLYNYTYLEMYCDLYHDIMIEHHRNCAYAIRPVMKK